MVIFIFFRDWWPRAALGLVALAQITIGLTQILGVGTTGGHAGHGGELPAGHLFNESTAWNLAVGIGLTPFWFVFGNNCMLTIPPAHVAAVYDPLRGGVQRPRLLAHLRACIRSGPGARRTTSPACALSLLREKLPHRPHKRPGLLQRWRVPTAVDDMQGGVRQRLLVQLSTIDWHDGILFTPNDQRRDLDPTHIRRQLRVMEIR